MNGRVHLDEYDDSGHVQHRWVREEPVPPLPTAPYTVIRVTWKGDAFNGRLTLDDGIWYGRSERFYYSERLAELITGFEVVSEPRAVTAKAVLDRVWEEGYQPAGVISRLRAEFGVEL